MTPLAVLSPWQAHVRRWSGCTRCELSKRRTQVVLARGELPCDVLFIGQGPGRSEDLLGEPFVGPAGHLLDAMVAMAFGGRPGEGGRPTAAFTNLVACVPLNEEGTKDVEPDPLHIKACASRLQELVAMAAPKMIVCVGGLARRWLDRSLPGRKTFAIEIDHPAAILRQPASHRNLARQKAEVRIRNGLVKLGQPTAEIKDQFTGTKDQIPF